MASIKMGVQRVQEFIRKKLPARLKADLRALRMIGESDFECCAFRHLGKFLARDRTWSVFARKHSVHTGHFIDLLIFRKRRPRIAIELKWNRASISKKDRLSLTRSIKKLRVNKAYFITTLIGSRKYTKTRKKEGQRYTLFEIVIPLALSGDKLKEWKENRRAYRSQMLLGKKAPPE